MSLTTEPAAVIDIRRPSEQLATCRLCGTQRNLPNNWQALMRDSLPTEQALHWDGVLRCRNGHHPEAMAIVPVTNYARLRLAML